MFAQHSRSVLLAGLLTAALAVPAWSADRDAVTPQTPAAEPTVMLAASPQTGPVVARESLATETSARSTVVVGESQPTRSSGTPTVGKRYASTRASGYRPAYRHSLMLGIAY